MAERTTELPRLREDEVAAIRAVLAAQPEARLGMVINWGRSAIEGRSAAAATRWRTSLSSAIPKLKRSGRDRGGGRGRSRQSGAASKRSLFQMRPCWETWLWERSTRSSTSSLSDSAS